MDPRLHEVLSYTPKNSTNSSKHNNNSQLNGKDTHILSLTLN